MTERLIRTLEIHLGKWVSGETMAKQCGCSRTCISRQIQKLRLEGYPIEASTRKGYRLLRNWDALSIHHIEKNLKAQTITQIHLLDQTDSTNRQCKIFARQKAPEGTLVLTEAQTSGSGRRERSFFSPAHKGIYMSLLLRPACTVQDATLITSAAAVALCHVLRQNYNLQPSIKWVNDVLLQGKKIAGILTEAELEMEANHVSYVILGLGLNVHEKQEEFPEALQSIATSLTAVAPLAYDRNFLISSFINEFFDLYRGLGKRSFMPQYRHYSCCLDRKIQVFPFYGTPYPAYVKGINDQAELMIEKEDGSSCLLNSGEVSIRC
ncbi:biotin--[acetyl-CoA-carboxylase] ligase [Holdemania massiliensis]|uniref:biotin--[acetyl-CoA-carboxylase] ligase n=1 Tax=Holdemania massiliensis TaxID=1468449 RepID=UPI00142F03CB|nr:biotin--[acetyl-CoA-carboxylase] ligase [Holdemania massiliensis]